MGGTRNPSTPNASQPPTSNIEMTPDRFYAIVAIAQAMKAEASAAAVWDSFLANVEGVHNNVAQIAEFVATTESALRVEKKPKKGKKNAEDDGDAVEKIPDVAATPNDNTLTILSDVLGMILAGYSALAKTARHVRPPENLRIGAKRPTDRDGLLREMEPNSAALRQFTMGLLSTTEARGFVVTVARNLAKVLDDYYQILAERHSDGGIEIHGDPILTDLATVLFANVDPRGEIEAGKKPSEISVYAKRKAHILAEGMTGGLVGEIVGHPERFLGFITSHMKQLWKVACELQRVFAPMVGQVRQTLLLNLPPPFPDAEFTTALENLVDLDPNGIAYAEKTSAQTPEERHALAFHNATLKDLAGKLAEHAPAEDLVRVALERKAALRDYYLEENSFYTCKISSGDVAKGHAPGALVVEPDTRPTVKLDEIVGSGFDQVKGFVVQIESAAEWGDIFVATSPSGESDKANGLLIGPPGCGKTQVLRAIGADKKSIGVFATSSDFLTAWKGESEKNPKRLFRECVRLQKMSNKHVHILIDEIDTLLAKPDGKDGFGGTNLTTEFQNLMSGVVHYPRISVWGATNHPERIPMAMIRRFQKVVIVGELNAEHRVHLLKFYMGFMPLAESFKDDHWTTFAEKTEGAVGDILRKICDHVWREKMTAFVAAKPDEARSLIAWLNRDGPFDIRNFGAAARAELHDRLRPHVAVEPSDLRASITMHLENMAVHNEIVSAKATYAKAKDFLSNVQKSNSPLTILGGR